MSYGPHYMLKFQFYKIALYFERNMATQNDFVYSYIDKFCQLMGWLYLLYILLLLFLVSFHRIFLIRTKNFFHLIVAIFVCSFLHLSLHIGFR